MPKEFCQRHIRDSNGPDGTTSCPYPTINGALDDAQPGDRVLIKEGRYSEYIMRFELNDVKIEGYPDENVIIDGTIPLNTEWVPYNHNGHNIYKTVIDFDSKVPSISEIVDFDFPCKLANYIHIVPSSRAFA